MGRKEGGPMDTLAGRGRALWGGFLIILGGVLLLEYFMDLGVWPWIIFLSLFGLGFYALYATDHSQMDAHPLFYIVGDSSFTGPA